MDCLAEEERSKMRDYSSGRSLPWVPPYQTLLGQGLVPPYQRWGQGDLRGTMAVKKQKESTTLLCHKSQQKLRETTLRRAVRDKIDAGGDSRSQVPPYHTLLGQGPVPPYQEWGQGDLGPVVVDYKLSQGRTVHSQRFPALATTATTPGTGHSSVTFWRSLLAPAALRETTLHLAVRDKINAQIGDKGGAGGDSRPLAPFGMTDTSDWTDLTCVPSRLCSSVVDIRSRVKHFLAITSKHLGMQSRSICEVLYAVCSALLCVLPEALS